MYVNKVLFYFFLTVIYSLNIIAQDADSIITYNLNEITVSGGIVIEPKPVTKIESEIIEHSDGNSLFQLGKFIPSLKPQTNSRGESLFYLRGANERQLGLFFDGAYVNIPWDNRIDLSLIPASAVNELKIIKGIPSVIYGANNIAGVINSYSSNYDREKIGGKVSAQIGENNSYKLNGFVADKIEALSFLLSASLFKTDGFTLPISFNNSENPDDLRLNSYQKTYEIFTKLNYDYARYSNVQLSVQYLNSEKGVPPEIDVSKPRYWQYPLWRKYGMTITGKHNFDLGKNSSFDYVVNIYNFNMQIDQFTDETYSEIDNVEKDNDFVLYGRLIYTNLLSLNSILRFSLSGYNTTHKEKFLSTDYREDVYTQNVYSAGVEYELVGNNFLFIAGTSFDGTNSPQTGTYTSKDALGKFSFTASIGYFFTSTFSTQINLGRKSRFPSLRESFSDALGRFVINPDLNAETITEGDIGFKHVLPNGEIKLNFFLSYLKDGIIRSVVETNEGNMFMRVNQEEIRSYGIEFESNYSITNRLNAALNISFLNSFGKNENGDYKDTLEYRPKFITGLYFNYFINKNFNATLEMNFIGDEYGLQEGYKYYRELPSYLLVNLRFAYTFFLTETQNVELYFRVNNIFDKLYYSQWGLPEAGRQFWGGAIFKF